MANKKKVPTTMKRNGSKKQTNAWLSHLERFRKDHPDAKGKEVMSLASETYVRLCTYKRPAYRARIKTVSAFRPVKPRMESSFAGKEDVCPICHESMRPEDQCWACNLDHIFHCRCIYKWMKESSRGGGGGGGGMNSDNDDRIHNCACPICREPMQNVNNVMSHSHFQSKSKEGRPKMGFVARMVPNDCTGGREGSHVVYVATTPKPRVKVKRPSS